MKSVLFHPLKLQKQTLNSEESPYSFLSSSSEISWYQLLDIDESSQVAFTTQDHQIFRFLVETSRFTQLNERTVYNILDFVGDIGGLYDGLKIIGYIFAMPFQSFSHMSILATSIFSINSQVPRDQQETTSLEGICKDAKKEI